MKLGKSEELLSLAEVKVMGYAFGKSYLLVGWEGKESAEMLLYDVINIT